MYFVQFHVFRIITILLFIYERAFVNMPYMIRLCTPEGNLLRWVYERAFVNMPSMILLCTPEGILLRRVYERAFVNLTCFES